MTLISHSDAPHIMRQVTPDGITWTVSDQYVRDSVTIAGQLEGRTVTRTIDRCALDTGGEAWQQALDAIRADLLPKDAPTFIDLTDVGA